MSVLSWKLGSSTTSCRADRLVAVELGEQAGRLDVLSAVLVDSPTAEGTQNGKGTRMSVAAGAGAHGTLWNGIEGEPCERLLGAHDMHLRCPAG